MHHGQQLRVLGSPHGWLTAVGRDECEAGGMLMLMLDVIRRIHAEVFRQLPAQPEKLGMLTLPATGWPAWDARNALRRKQQQVQPRPVRHRRCGVLGWPPCCCPAGARA